MLTRALQFNVVVGGGVNGNKGLLHPPPPPSHQSIGLKDALKQMKAFEAHEEKEKEQAAQPGGTFQYNVLHCVVLWFYVNGFTVDTHNTPNT